MAVDPELRDDRQHARRLVLATAVRSEAFRRYHCRATLVGGGAIEFYAPGAYRTDDIIGVHEAARATLGARRSFRRGAWHPARGAGEGGPSGTIPTADRSQRGSHCRADRRVRSDGQSAPCQAGDPAAPGTRQSARSRLLSELLRRERSEAAYDILRTFADRPDVTVTDEALIEAREQLHARLRQQRGNATLKKKPTRRRGPSR